MKEILVGSHNLGKIAEMQQYLDLLGEKILLKPVKITPPNETGMTYEENALQKANYYYEKEKKPVLVDDGGLELEAFPEILGVKTQRFFKSETNEGKNQELAGLFATEPNKNISLISVLVYYKNPNEYFLEKSILKGKFVSPRGNLGYGFDPIFYLPQKNKTLGELSERERGAFSPRITNLKKLVPYF